MRFLKFIALIFICFKSAFCQVTNPQETPSGRTLDPKFDKRISKLIDFSVPILTVEEFAKQQNDFLVFDTREEEEFEVSHIPGAKYLGYDDFDPIRLEGVKKDQKIVLYCSVGYRSEKIGNKLQEMGFTKVYNLYGSIFEWVNQERPVVDKNGQPTKKVHTFNWFWGKWVDEKKAEKTH